MNDGGIVFVLMMNSLFLIAFFIIAKIQRKPSKNLKKFQNYQLEKPLEKIENNSITEKKEEEKELTDDLQENENKKEEEKENEWVNIFDNSQVITEEKESKNPFWWIYMTWKIKEEKIKKKIGSSGWIYLKFQKYTMILFAILSIISVGIIMPINISGNSLPEDQKGFGSTTVNNISSNSNLLVFHCIFQIVFTILVFGYIYHFYKLILNSHSHLNSKQNADKIEPYEFTVLVEKIPTNITENELKNLFDEKFPDDVLFCYIVRDLKQISDLREQLFLHLDRLSYYQNEKLNDAVKDLTCGCFPSEDDVNILIEETTKKIKKLESKIKSLYSNESIPQKLPTAFVVFKRPPVVWLCLSDQKSRKIFPNFKITQAPEHYDVNWKSFSLGRKKKIINGIVVFTLLVLLLILYSSPIAFLNSLERLRKTEAFKKLAGSFFSAFIYSYLPAIAMYLFSSFIPSLVKKGISKLGKKSYSSEEITIMKTDFAFFFLGLEFLPFVSSVYIYVIIEDYLSSNSFWSMFKEAFLVDHGAAFINLLIQFAFYGCGMQLLQFSDSFQHWKLRKKDLSQNERKFELAKLEKTKNFPFGPQFALQATIIGIVLLFSIMIPLIAPFGLIYFLFKYTVDKYNFLTFYSKGLKASGSILDSTVSQIFFVLTFFNLAMSGYFILRNRLSLFSISIILFFISIIIWILFWYKIRKFHKEKEAELEITKDQDREFFPNQTFLKHSYNWESKILSHEKKLWGEIEKEDLNLWNEKFFPKANENLIENLIENENQNLIENLNENENENENLIENQNENLNENLQSIHETSFETTSYDDD
ncbi:putative membrane protein [Anaeramoeba ignava]|uniref:Membrane protein n=1 Tax=Anaeramoeba ignava TaxID=1746090 RepID=A0A9Q0L8B6_ANAIG|nr:putative membrane protein [Anaeramoeba ignava]